MLQVTDRALDKLAEIRDGTDAQTDEGIALIREDDGSISLMLAVAGEKDQVIERDGKPVIIVTEELDQPLDGLVFDYVETPDEAGFTLGEVESDSPAE